MGAWSKDSFGNDTACDWIYDLEKTSDLSLVRETIQKTMNAGDEYLEAPEAEETIAAAEIIARLKNNLGEHNSYTESADAWVTAHPQQPPQDLVTLADQALDRIFNEPSELLELWRESDDFEAWKSSVLELKGRLQTSA